MMVNQITLHKKKDGLDHSGFLGGYMSNLNGFGIASIKPAFSVQIYMPLELLYLLISVHGLNLNLVLMTLLLLCKYKKGRERLSWTRLKQLWNKLRLQVALKTTKTLKTFKNPMT